jgi:hypothetical protein
VISTVAVAPAGIAAPLEPETEFATVALKRWPTRCVFVQIRELDVSEISEPAAIDPSRRSDPAVPRVTVLPLAVVVGAAGAGAGRAGVVVRGGVRDGVLTVVLGELAAGAGLVATALGDSSAGTSCRAGCDIVS